MEDARKAALGRAALHDGASAGWLYVANLKSTRVSVFTLDHKGLPAHDATQQFSVDSPAWVVAGPDPQAFGGCALIVGAACQDEGTPQSLSASDRICIRVPIFSKIFLIKVW
ncbi:MAG: hypothetical protein M3017_02790 [Actinomycetota bacterium]|nr:hypothetical protein [Actinomycetota bacterium]